MSDSPLSILYVDDEPLLLELTRVFLTGMGFIVDTAESGSEALQKVTGTSYDAVVSDYQMPGMDGIELLKEIRRNNPEIPFILFTGRGREEVVIEAIENGADFYIQKGGKPAPQFTELTHKIKTAVQQRRDNRALRESELRFRSLIQNSSDIIRILDKEGMIVFDSPSSSAILGYPEGSLVGSRAFDYIHPEDQERVRSDFLDVYHQCNTHTPTQYRIRKADGSYLFVESIALNLMGVPGIDGIVTTTHSIHTLKMAEMENRKMADDLSAAYEELSSSEEELRENYLELARHEEALEKSEQRFRSMAERSSDLIIILNTGMSPTYVSPSARPIIGYDPEELVGKTPEFAAETIFSLRKSDFSHGIRKTMKGEPVDNAEFQIRKKDGTPVYVSLSAVPTFHDGIITGAQVSMRDITLVKKTELALRESEERFRRFASNAQDLLFRMSLPDGRYEYISPALESLTGYTPDEFYSDPGIMKRLIHPAWRKYFNEQWNALLRKGVPPIYEFQIIDRSGKTRWVNQRNVLVTDEDGEPVALEGIVTDVTRQKHTEHELLKSEQRFLASTSNAGSWVWEINTGGIYTYASPAVEGILGYRPDELVGKICFYDLFDPSCREELKRTAMKAFKTRDPFSGFVNLNRHKNGSAVILKTSGTPVFTDEGIFSGYCGVDLDITKEKEAEEKLVESEAKYRLLAENVHDVIWIVDEHMHLSYISPSIMGLQGFSPKEAMLMSFRDLLTPESYHTLVRSHRDWIDNLKNSGSLPEKISVELEYRCKNGSTVWTEMLITPVFNENKKFSGSVGVTRDITQRRKADEALRRANRQLSLLSGITRHDILNKISVIFVYLGLAEMQYVNPAISEYLRIINTATREIQSEIEFTRVYQDLGSQEPQWFLLDDVMPRSFFPVSVTLKTDLQDISIFADPMLEKVFFNLLDNSIRHGLWVSEIQVSISESGNGMTVVWEDNGIGIPEVEKDNIFEHGMGKNTGFGLFIVREVLSLTGITIRETGKAETGARFEILIPPGMFRISGKESFPEGF